MTSTVAADSAVLRLDQALLGLIHQQPRSGYALRKIFATTPMGHFSDSPGSIYPALRRLRSQGLVTGTVQRRQTLRPREVFRLTAKGRDALTRWVSAPVTRDELIHHNEGFMLRFVFAQQVLGIEGALRLVRTFRAALEAYVPELQHFYERESGAMPVAGRLALKFGLDVFRERLRWAGVAIRDLERALGRKEAV